jgi:hypothetical protein
MPGRKRRISRYLTQSLRKTKNLHTRRTRIANTQRDIRKLSSAKTNKRVSK